MIRHLVRSYSEQVGKGEPHAANALPTENEADVRKKRRRRLFANEGENMRLAVAVALAFLAVTGLTAAAESQAVIKHYDLKIPRQPLDTARALAWTQGRLVFDAAPLAEVVREFNRYNHAQLRVEDAELARRPISGVFQASDLETLIAFIRAGAHVQVREQNDEMLIAPEGG